MTNWDLIEATLDTAISDAEMALEQRRKDYAGFEHLADLPQHEEELQYAKLAREELAKLRERIANAPIVVVRAHVGDVAYLKIPVSHDFTNKRVRLVVEEE